ncbi:MAG: PSD1 and planctomycete cytochrome C domain-containing protein [Verrucomicrobiae bacterium]|nr:PSD1 and planctomycete cytochrome C domain-containing protein [Verrucomicrobiae bacterium]
MRVRRSALVVLLAAASAVLAEDRVEFNRDIRPIFSDTCYACHGPDEAKMKGKLRLDSLEAARRGGKSGDPAIVPGHPERSEVMKRLLTTDADDHMPPAEFHKVLSKEQIDLVARWIKEGAVYQGHWAFQTPKKPAVPAIPAGGNAIDGFVAQARSAKGLSGTPEAPRTTLLRRAALDLTGLPPSEADLAAFLADTSPDAWSKALDRLLASPHYGERMAAQWLDFARYADSNGFQSDTTRTMWPWRDWVIRAYNSNKPFDAFTIEQLAGDLLPNPTEDQIVATGFNRNHRLNGEGGRIVAEWAVETVIDRVETTGSTWMALTMNCCRCHDHKYDPISQKEFFQFFAYFNSNDETGVLGEFGGSASTRMGGNTPPTYTFATPAAKARLAEVEKAIAEAELAVKAASKNVATAQSAWERKLRQGFAGKTATWSALGAAQAVSNGGATLKQQPDGSWLVGGKNPDKDVYTITAPIPAGELTGLLLEVMPDASLPTQSLGRAPNGNFVLSGVDAILTLANGKKVELDFVDAQADFSQDGWPIKSLVEGGAATKGAKKARPARAKTGTGWAIGGNAAENRVPRKGLFMLMPTAVPPGATLTIALRCETLPNHNVGRFRLSTTGLPASLVSLKDTPQAAELRALILKDAATRTVDERKALAKAFADSPEHPKRSADAQLASLRNTKNTLPGIIDVMVMKELAKPKDAFLLDRGEYDKPTVKVERKLPAALPPLPAGEPNNRLGFARWLVSGQHPLTARVWVNRAWENFFGTGLVKTSENFGSQAEWPSHPELLDWLAVDFAENGWDMKRLQKLILMSQAYRQSTVVTPEKLEKDPENRWISRGPRFRLPAETIRDQALAVSGLLVPNYKADTGEGLYRRSLYTIWKRTAAPPSMLLFDSATREVCTVKRFRSNTPMQALSLLNEVTFVEASRKLAELTLRQPGTIDQRLAWAFQRVTSRPGTPAELAVLRKGLDRRLTAYAADLPAAKKLLANGQSAVPTDLDPAQLAAWTVTANVLLNLDETVTRE